MINNQLKDIRIARVSTIPFFVFTQLKEQLETLAKAGADVCIVTSNDEMKNIVEVIQGCRFTPIYLARKISLVADVVSVFNLWKLFRKGRYHIIHSTTPKAGLLCAIAAKLSKNSVCIHTFTGQVWVTMTGLKRFLVKNSDKLIGFLNPYSYTDSVSQKEFLIQNKIVAPNKIKVIGSGSLAGVDTRRFNQNNFSDLDRTRIRDFLGISASAKIILFIGRVNREKGIFELFDAMNKLIQIEKNIHLVVVGPFDEDTEDEVRSYAHNQGGNRIIFTGFQEKPEEFMAISEVLCLPSYREGFGTVVIEAAAMEIPVVGTNIYGLKDAIIDGQTGMLVEPRDVQQLADALEYLLHNVYIRKNMGLQAKARAHRDFASDHYNQLLIQEYQHLLNNIDR